MQNISIKMLRKYTEEKKWKSDREKLLCTRQDAKTNVQHIHQKQTIQSMNRQRDEDNAH